MRYLTALLVLLVACVSPGDARVAVPGAGEPAPRSSEVAGPPRVVVGPIVRPSDAAVRTYPIAPKRPAVPEPVASVRVVTVPTPRPRALVTGGHRASGVASWFCGHGSACTRGYPDGLYAAAGPALRVGDWRGRLVVVQRGSRRVIVRLVDWCACPHRTLDLYRSAFARLGSPSLGLIKVTVTW